MKQKTKNQYNKLDIKTGEIICNVKVPSQREDNRIIGIAESPIRKDEFGWAWLNKTKHEEGK